MVEKEEEKAEEKEEEKQGEEGEVWNRIARIIIIMESNKYLKARNNILHRFNPFPRSHDPTH